MKKYPFSNKAMKAMLAASIALSPFAASAFSAPVKVEAATTNPAVDRVTLIYSKLSKDAIKVFNDASKGIKEFKTNDWETVLGKKTFDHINKKLEVYNSGKSEKVSADSIASNLALIVYSSNASNLNSNLEGFKKSKEGKAFESVMGMNNKAIDTILSFLVDAEKKMWEKDFDKIYNDLINNGSIDTITKEVRDDLLTVDKYRTLNEKLYINLGTNLEGLIGIKDNINAKLISDGTLTPDQFNTLRNGFIFAAFKAGEPTQGQEGNGDDSNNSGGGAVGGGAGGGAITPPAGSTTVVEKGNKVITEIPAAKVLEIVNLLTEKNNVIPVKLEKVSGDKKAVAEIPANLFTEAGKKNSKAVVAIETEAAVYKLPVSEINVADLAKKLGVSAGDVKISISVNVVSANVKNKVADVVEFQITAVAGDKQQAVTAFSTYVDRVIMGAKEFSKGNSVAVRVNDNGTLTAIPTIFDGKNATVKSLTNSKYTVVENNISFKDVTDKSWAKGYIETLANKLIVKGKAADQYAPADHMTRAEFTVLLVRALGLPAEKYDGSFKDVKGTEWFNENGEIMAAVKHGIIKGINSKEFAPQAKITRAEAAVMIERAMNLSFVNYDKSQLDSKKTVADLKDAGKLQDWNKKAIEAVYQADIVSGRATKEFDPKGYTQRDEMAKILANFLTSAKLMN